MAIRVDEEQRVEKTLFNVVDEEMASQAGFRFDMLVGSKHCLPLQQKIGALAADEMSSADSSTSGRTGDLAAQCSGGWRDDAEQCPPPGPADSSPPQIFMLIFNGPDADINCVSVCRSLRHGPIIGSPAAGPLDGRSIES